MVGLPIPKPIVGYEWRTGLEVAFMFCDSTFTTDKRDAFSSVLDNDPPIAVLAFISPSLDTQTLTSVVSNGSKIDKTKYNYLLIESLEHFS